MGCVSDKQKSCEENSIIFSELALNYINISLPEYCEEIKNSSINNKLAPVDFQKISQEFNLNISNFSVHLNIEDFYEGLKDPEGYFSTADLISLAILLSDESEKTKTNLIFKYLAEPSSESIEKSLFKENILFRMILLCSDNLISLINQKQVDGEIELRIKHYKLRLLKYMTKATEALLDKFFLSETVSKQDLANLLLKKPYFLSASGLRNFIIDFRNHYKKKERLRKYPGSLKSLSTN